jgi:signal transduction histidine kinase
MIPRQRFRRRLFLAFLLVSLVPALLLLAFGAWAVGAVAGYTTSPEGWEGAVQSGRVLTELGAASDDPAIREAALRHREELSASLTQARRLEFVVERFRGILPWAGLLFAGLLVYLASRVAKYTARHLARPVRDLTGWAEAVGRGEPLPAGSPADPLRDEFDVLRNAFRGMEREIVAARARAVEAERDRARAQMARQVAHELKNPLTPMRFALRRLSAGDAGGDAEAIAVLEAETARLDRLARAFSQYGALPEGPPSEIDLVEMLEYLIRTHLPEGVGRLEVQPGVTTVITGRYEPLARAMANLLLNAGDVASGRPGSVQVSLEAAEGGVGIVVEDDGPGLPPGRDIWEPGVTSKEGGSGLGLAIVRRAVSAEGGEVEAATRPAGGARFSITLPVAGAAAGRTG